MPSDDVYISLKYERGGLRNVGGELMADPADRAPGWFLYVYRNEGYDNIVPYTRIKPEDVVSIAQRIDGVIGTPVGRAGVARAVTLANDQHARRRQELARTLRDRIAADQATLARLTDEAAQDA